MNSTCRICRGEVNADFPGIVVAVSLKEHSVLEICIRSLAARLEQRP